MGNSKFKIHYPLLQSYRIIFLASQSIIFSIAVSVSIVSKPTSDQNQMWYSYYCHWEYSISHCHSTNHHPVNHCINLPPNTRQFTSTLFQHLFTLLFLLFKNSMVQPILEELVKRIKEEVLNGKLKWQVAQDLGVSYDTVKKYSFMNNLITT